MRSKLVRIHRWLSLCAAMFWLLQALSGTWLVFGRTIDDLALHASGRAADMVAVDRAIVAREATGAHVIQFFASGGVPGQIDLMVDHAGKDRRVVRIDGASGKMVRESAWDGPFGQIAFSRLVLLFHRELLAGPAGEWLIALSGLLLLSNILFGLKLAWPARARWRATLLPARGRTAMASLYGWHKALGLWLAPLIVMMAMTGILLVFSPGLDRLVASGAIAPDICRASGPIAPGISAATAVKIAAGVFPGASIAVVTPPGGGNECYAIQMRQAGEVRRVFGTSYVYLNARTGAVVSRADALTAPVPVKAVAALYAIHTGEWGGTTTRIVTLVIGLSLQTLIVFGISLWALRRRRGKARQ